jgi:mono/diheme cytochrome c family protein
MTHPPSRFALVFGPLLLVWGCSSGPPAARPGAQPDRGDQALGRSLYETPLADGNSFSCATCHALGEPSPDGLRRAGHPLGDATRRRHWKNGKAPTFLAAVNSCLTDWMVAPTWAANDPQFLALRDFLDSQATVEHADDLRFEIVPPPAELAGGDVARGRSTFDRTCSVCHGTGGIGTDRGPRVAGSVRTPEYIAKRIRSSGSPKSAVYGELSGGVMPFWAKDRLSDGEVRDLVAFIRHDAPAADASAPVADAGVPPDAAPPTDASADAVVAHDTRPGSPDVPPASGCGKTNPRVGWTADLGINTGEGQVSGFVTMIDDCTLQLTKFSYDGNGIDVRVFGSKVKTFRPGFVIGPDLFGHRYTKATLNVTLPPGKTLDDLDWVSIWCTKARADFGSGPFLPPP